MKVEDSFESNFGEIVTIVSQITDSLVYLNNYCEHLNSKMLKEIVSQNLRLGYNVDLTLADTIKLYEQFYKYNIGEISSFSADTVKYVKSSLDVINEISDDNIKNPMNANLYRTLVMSKQTIESQQSVFLLNRVLLESSILIAAYNTYHALNIVNNKYKDQNIKKRIKELVGNVVSLTPEGQFKSLIDFFVSVPKLVNAVEDENAGEEFVFAADDTVTLLEKQSEYLQYSY